MNDRTEQSLKVAIESKVLRGKRALVLGIANEHSIAYGCARVFRQLGADLAITYLNEKARPYVEPLANALDASILAPCDVGRDGELEAVFGRIRETWGSLDIALHSIAFAPKEDLQGRLLDSTDEGFKVAMDISCHSFIRMARLAEPLMTEGGTLLAMSYHGANKVVPNYNLMGPVKAALESAVRYLAYDLGPRNIRVNAISAGAIKTASLRGIKDGSKLLEAAPAASPLRRATDPAEVADTAAFLASDLGRGVTGNVIYVDAGFHIMGLQKAD